MGAAVRPIPRGRKGQTEFGGGGVRAKGPLGAGLCLVGAGAGDDPLPWGGDLSRIQPHMPVSSVGRSPALWATE